jgi:hypothetical protein
MSIALLFLTISVIAQNSTSKLKPYDEIITTDIITKKGFITTHLLENKLYLEIPPDMLNKEMLFMKNSNSKHIKWLKKENRIHLFKPDIISQVGNVFPTDKKYFIKKITPTTFPILAINDTTLSYVIDVTSLFLNPPSDLIYSRNTGSIIDDLGFINKTHTIDKTIEVFTTKTITSENGPITVNDVFDLMLLPEVPMMPRLFDHRIGFFNDKEGGDALHRDRKSRNAIIRYRLEKKNPDQSLSDPIKPITVYFDPKMPDRWKPYVKAGIEQWLPAFEAAGFKNAIEVKEPPIDDENFSVHSIRYSIVRWLDNTQYRGKEGGSWANADWIIDRRSGEILKGIIKLGAPYEYLSDEYFVRCSPLDIRAQQYPFPDDLMGELIERVTAHEAGHMFGLIDGNYGEYTYPFEKMRDKNWLEEMGHTPSAMNYARDNFIPQPEDNMPLHLLRQKVGPTDLYSIRWGYTPFKEAKTPDEETPYLEKIVREQDSIPWYRFNMTATNYGPQSTNEVVESDDPIKATILGIKNLKRVIKIIPNATRNEPRDEVKTRLLNKSMWLWVNQMKSVVSLVGSYTIQNKSSSQKGAVFFPIPVKKQKEAVAFLNANAFEPPLWLAPQSLLTRINNYGSHQKSLITISEKQKVILLDLLNNNRLDNIVEMQLVSEDSYKLSEFFQDLNKGIWSELESTDIKVNPYRQETQMTYINILKSKLQTDISKSRGDSYRKSVIQNTLNKLSIKLKKAIKKTKDVVTKSHLELCLMEINKIQS